MGHSDRLRQIAGVGFDMNEQTHVVTKYITSFLIKAISKVPPDAASVLSPEREMVKV